MRVLANRFDELRAQLAEIENSQTKKYSEYTGQYNHIDPELILNWSTKAKSLISRACGKDSEHYNEFIKAETPQSFQDNVARLKLIKAVFLAAMEDFNGGYLNTVRNLVQAEVAGNELDQARELLSSGYATASAVVAGVVLETTLRSLCSSQGIPIGSMERMNADLVKAGQYNSLVQKRITALAAIRNSAAHGKVDEFGTSDVRNLITEVERFVAEVLS